MSVRDWCGKSNLMEEDRRRYSLNALDHGEKLRSRDWKAMNRGLSGWNLYLP